MKEKITKIKLFMWENNLKNAWLMCELRKRGIIVDKSGLSEILNGRREGKKALDIIQKSMQIIEKYESNFLRK